jgi:phosphotransferase system  glucose/maltose/N-acetylglucosamine-specific IIC component
MGKLKLNNSNMNAGGSAGGIMGSGIFGMFGSTVRCDANNNSFYCSITKLVNLIIMFFFLCIVFYLLYIAFNYFTKGKKNGRK